MHALNVTGNFNIKWYKIGRFPFYIGSV